ncbi:hypothetical protein ACPA9J_22445 [Pseudomonas aeruginosa]
MLAAIDGQTRVVFVASEQPDREAWFGADDRSEFLARVPAEVRWCWTRPI